MGGGRKEWEEKKGRKEEGGESGRGRGGVEQMA